MQRDETETALTLTSAKQHVSPHRRRGGSRRHGRLRRHGEVTAKRARTTVSAHHQRRRSVHGRSAHYSHRASKTCVLQRWRPALSCRRVQRLFRPSFTLPMTSGGDGMEAKQASQSLYTSTLFVVALFRPDEFIALRTNELDVGPSSICAAGRPLHRRR